MLFAMISAGLILFSLFLFSPPHFSSQHIRKLSSLALPSYSNIIQHRSTAELQVCCIEAS